MTVDPNRLTFRQTLILLLVIRGMTNMEISHELKIKNNVVRSNIQRMLIKMGVESRTGMAAYAIRNWRY